MPKAKPKNTASKSTRPKAKTPLRDLMPNKQPREVFTIHQLKEGEGPSVEPLIEDEGGGEVEIHRIEPEYSYVPPAPPKMNVTPVDDGYTELKSPDLEELIPKETIKVKFGKFVQLVANRDFAEVIDAHADDEIIMSSNLLTELAGAHDRREEKKIPLVFLVGIVIGVVLTYIFFSQ
jgi:hypothetical protein